MDGHGIGIVYHQRQLKVTCCRCGAAWEERFLGVRYMSSDGRKGDGENQLCPRCIEAPLSIGFLIRQEIAWASLEPNADPEEVRRNVIARYTQFLKS